MARISEKNGPLQQRTVSLWRNSDFLLLWSGQGVSILGTSISTLALPILILAMTHSPAQAGFIAAAQAIPYLILSLPAGALIDRWNRKIVMIVCDYARLLAFGSVPLTFAFNHLTILQLYFVAFLTGAATVFFNSASIAALPRIVAKEQVAQANSLNASAEYAATLIGPGLSGFIIGLAKTTLVGAVVAYTFDGLSYLLSGLSLSFIRTPFQEERPDENNTSLLKDIMQGLQFLRTHRQIRTLAFLLACIGIFSSPADLALIVLAQQQLHTTAQVIGIIFSIGSVGGLLGAFIAGPIASRLKFGQIIIGTTVLEAVAAGLLAVAIFPFMLMIGLGFIAVAIPIFGVTQLSYRLSLIPDALQGRMNSIFDLLFFGSQPLGLAIGGILLTSLGPRIVLWIIACGLALSAIVVGLTSIRKA